MLRHKPSQDQFASRFVPHASTVAAAEVATTSGGRGGPKAVLFLSTIEAAAGARVRRDARASKLPLVTQEVRRQNLNLTLLPVVTQEGNLVRP
jgi:hypothetical protein